MLKVAVIDMYDGTSNLGMASIIRLLEENVAAIDYQVFDIRSKGEVPDLGFDMYISSGGPGSPLDGNERWEAKYFSLLDELWLHNETETYKKHVFFICHSFQIACNHFGIGQVELRPQESFGIFKVDKTEKAYQDRIFTYLPDPFYAADFRQYQVVKPDMERIASMGAEILAVENISGKTSGVQALMAVRFSDTMYGVQFHPEAYPEGMMTHFREPARKKSVLDRVGSGGFEEMMFHLRDPIKIGLTYKKVLPAFLNFAARSLHCEQLVT